MSACDLCPAGFYCNATLGPVVTYDPYVCPEGYYCPNGTEHDQQYPCPINTFNNGTGLFFRGLLLLVCLIALFFFLLFAIDIYLKIINVVAIHIFIEYFHHNILLL